MEGHAQKCVEFCGELTHSTVDQLYEVSTTQCLDDHHIKPEDLEIVGEFVRDLLSHCVEMPVFGKNRKIAVT